MWKQLIEELGEEGFSPAIIYRATGVSQSTTSRILSGKATNPKLEGALKLLTLHVQQFPGKYQGRTWRAQLEHVCESLDIEVNEVNRFQMVDLSEYKLVPRKKAPARKKASQRAAG